ncbi:LamG-like jellyroll fold domain-containing protein [Calditrichota bacterium GD2]
MKEYSLFIIFIIFFLSCSKKETTEPSPTTGTISGTVMNKAGDAAVPAAIITTEPPTSSVSTDNDGKYTIEEVDPGDYIVQAVKDGFDPGNVNVTVKAGKTVTADIRMGILLANHPPSKPQLLAPENNSEYQSIDLQLQWKEAADPDGDAVVYDLYFGKENPPPLDMENLDSTHISKSNLDTATVYYWQVVAKDSKGAESASDLWQFKTTPNPIPTDGLIAYWPFNGNANDESGNGNDGEIIGGVSSVKDRFGNNNKALEFNGVDGFIQVPNSQSLQFTTNQISASAWIYIDEWFYQDTIRFAPIISKENDTPENSVSSTDYEMLIMDDSIGIWPFRQFAYSFNLHKWYFVAFSWDGNKLDFYLDGNKKESDTFNSILQLTNRPLHIGANLHLGNEYLDGILDDIRIYNRALNASEIKNIFHEGGWQVR